MKMGSIYSASDKALFDALTQSAVTNADLREIFLTHGIVISHTTNRTTLAAHFSRLVHDYADFQALAKLFDTGQRRERLASFHVHSSAQLDNFEVAAHTLVQQIKDTDAANVSANADGSIKITVRYKTFHFNKSEFRQVETRNAVITIEKDGDAIVVRGPQNEKVDEICRSLLATVKADITGDFDISEVNLELFPEPNQRTSFFLDLIVLVPGYKKHDVTDVFVFKPKARTDLDQNVDEVKADGDEDDEDTHLGIHISRASLKGEGVLESEEMKTLISRGFYISKIIWQAKTDVIGSDIYEFEAQFSEPESCTRFSYLAKGHYKYQENGIYSHTRTQLSTDEDIELSKAIETASRASMNKLSACIKDK